jgi:hypothetical protein
MHNGRISGLTAVFNHYGQGGVPNKWLSPLITPLPPAGPQTFNELIEFLNALVGEWPENVGPPE